MKSSANDNRILVSINDVCEMTSLSRTAICKLRSDGAFPKDVPLGERRVGFVRAEVIAWIERRIGDRSAA